MEANRQHTELSVLCRRFIVSLCHTTIWTLRAEKSTMDFHFYNSLYNFAA